MVDSKIKIINVMDELPDSFSIEYEYNGIIKGHTFPKDARLLDKDNDGIPDFVNKLIEIEIEREDMESEFVKTAKPKLKEYVIKQEKVDEIRTNLEKKRLIPAKYKGGQYVKLWYLER